MIRLVAVELTRLRKRRAVVLLLLAALVAPLLMSAATLWSTRPLAASEIQRAEQLAAQERSQPYVQQEVRRCVTHPDEYGIEAGTDAGTEEQCRRQVEPRAEWFLDRSQLSLGRHLHDDWLAMVALSTVLLMLAAATFIGHDWNSGSMSNQLLFEPRRQRVFWAKATAVLLVAGTAALMVHLLFWGPLVGGMSLRNLPIRDGTLPTIGWAVLRASVLAGLAALGAYAVTMLFRSTVVTLGLLFAVVVLGSIVTSMVPWVERERLQLTTNAAAWIFGKADYYRHVSEACWSGPGTPPTGPDCQEIGRLGLWGAARYFGALLALSLGLSAWSFHRRDVP